MTSTQRIHSCRITGTGIRSETCDPTLVFPYWSFTKSVIAICGLTLAEAGRIDLDARLAGEAFTLRQLLQHTAGLPDYSTLKAYRDAVANDEEPWSRDELLEAALAQGRQFAPGAGWSYSNVGYMLARECIEDAAERPFGSLFSALVGERLGLESVELATTRDEFARVCWEGARTYHPGWVYHGCLIGTAEDAARLLHGLFTGRLLGEATLERMLDPYPLGGAIEGRPWTQCGYGLGLMNGRFGAAGRAIGHSGGGPFCVNAVYHFPDRDDPMTVASFTDGRNEGIAEFAAAGYAARDT
ncbi:serine hydrolase domain-containing protein [Acuticoccus sediminis]|uniref:serine hydrolase domain-containing protein n=1 Tax=Acuticoccus sediminis TaxID=2184697 RepID=UPI001CFD538B|nr:serine hydrolase domain-containing protein [Acuticoccus sediminis]